MFSSSRYIFQACSINFLFFKICSLKYLINLTCKASFRWMTCQSLKGVGDATSVNPERFERFHFPSLERALIFQYFSSSKWLSSSQHGDLVLSNPFSIMNSNSDLHLSRTKSLAIMLTIFSYYGLERQGYYSY